MEIKTTEKVLLSEAEADVFVDYLNLLNEIRQALSDPKMKTDLFKIYWDLIHFYNDNVELNEGAEGEEEK